MEDRLGEVRNVSSFRRERASQGMSSGPIDPGGLVRHDKRRGEC